MSQQGPSLFVSFLLGAALSGGAVWYLRSPDPIPEDAQGGGSQTDINKAPGDLASENQRLRTELAALKMAAERQQLSEAATTKKAPAETAEASTKTASYRPIVADPKLEETLGKIDWDLCGKNMLAMTPLITQLAEQLAKGEQPDLATAGEIQKLNGDLLKLAKILQEQKVPGAGVNGSFTHPSVVANQIGATLAQAGLALSEEQQASLAQKMRYYGAKDDSLRLSEGDRDFSIESLLEEADYKNDFYREAKALLTPEQRKLLGSDTTAGRLGLDIFDSSLMLTQYAKPVRCKSPAEFVGRLSQQIQATAKLGPEDSKQLKAVLSEWSAKMPKDLFAKPADTLSARGSMRSADIRAALRRQVELFRMLNNRVNLSPEVWAQMKKSRSIFVPLPRG